MKRLWSMAYWFVALTSFTFFTGCEEDQSGTGTFIVAVTNNTSKAYSLEIYIDGTLKGSFIAQANQKVNTSTSWCDARDAATYANNVYIVDFVSSGSHKLELRESVTGVVRVTASFSLKAGGCTTQPIEFS